jgi:hypothetical protein
MFLPPEVPSARLAPSSLRGPVTRPVFLSAPAARLLPAHVSSTGDCTSPPLRVNGSCASLNSLRPAPARVMFNAPVPILGNCLPPREHGVPSVALRTPSLTIHEREESAAVVLLHGVPSVAPRSPSLTIHVRDESAAAALPLASVPERTLGPTTFSRDAPAVVDRRLPGQTIPARATSAAVAASPAPVPYRERRLLAAPSNSSQPSASLADFGESVNEFVSFSDVFTHKERVARVAAAARLYTLASDRRWLPPLCASQSVSAYREQFVCSLAKAISHSHAAEAVNAVLDFEHWASTQPCPPYPTSSVALAQYLQHVARRRRLVAGRADRGLAAKGRLKGLQAASKYAFAPFSRDLLDHTFVRQAARSTVSPAARKEYMVSFELALLLEDLALSDPSREFWGDARACRSARTAPTVSSLVSHVAQALLVMLHTVVRGASALRLSVVSLLPPDEVCPYLRLALSSSGDKRPSSSGMRVTQHWCLAEGFLPGMALWFPDFFNRHRGRDHFFSCVASPVRDDILRATGWSDVPADTATITSYLRQIATLAPVSQSSAQSQVVLLASRGLRHVFPALASAFDIADPVVSESRFALGRWSPRARVGQVAMPVLYAGSEQALLTEVHARLGVLSAVRSWLGDNDWQDVVPRQAGMFPSYAFLSRPARSLHGATSSSLVGAQASHLVTQPAAASLHVDNISELVTARRTAVRRPSALSKKRAIVDLDADSISEFAPDVASRVGCPAKRARIRIQSGR